MLRLWSADLHIHTALSPCAEEEMTPPAIVEAAVAADLALIAICDHNSMENVEAVQDASEGESLTVLAGMEITTAEEVHVLGLFPNTDAARSVGRLIRETLPLGEKEGRLVQCQWLLNAAGEQIGWEMGMLSSASGFTLKEVVEMVHASAGLAVASHVDRPSFSVTSQLGFIPDDVDFDALEISSLAHADWRKKHPMSLGVKRPILFSS
ncbi:MAG TPA: PHP domain-containing protein, partial [bacterium]|nr:PHP domain-containing protein [bacterium]